MTNKFIFAPPGGGKSYIATEEAIDFLDRGKEVYSNYPIRSPRGRYSRVWKREFIYKNVQNALIVWDESQQDFDSAECKTLDEDEDAFFATSGQNQLEIRIISQGITRVTKAVRDRMNEWIFVEILIDIPFLRNARGKLGRPLIFKSTVWLSLDDMASRSRDRVYLVNWHWFSKRVALAYSTVFFKRTGEIFTPPSWEEEIERRGGQVECLTGNSYTLRQACISAAKNWDKLSQIIKNKVHDLNLSLRYHTGRGKIQIQDFYEGGPEEVQR